MVTTTDALKVEIKELPAQEYLGRRFVAALDSVGHDVQEGFGLLYKRISEARSRPAGPPFLIASQPSGGVMEIEVGAPCDPVPAPPEGMHAGRLDGGPSAVLLYRGPYDKIGPVYGRLFAWIAEHGHRPAGPPREVYLNGPDQVRSADEYITELVVPIT